MERFLLICLGGAIGTGARYLTTIAAARWLGAEFPYGTLIVNVVGSFVIGLVSQLRAGAPVISDTTLLFITTGMMGGLTTYSAFSIETMRMMERGAWLSAWINVVATTAVCLGVCFLGIAAGRGLVPLRG